MQTRVCKDVPKVNAKTLQQMSAANDVPNETQTVCKTQTKEGNDVARDCGHTLERIENVHGTAGV